MDFEVAYPEIVPGVTDWANSDDRGDSSLSVTAHGLRRLLRIAADTQSSLMQRMCDRQKLSDDDMKLLNDVTAVWCEGDLVMSGLFIINDKPVVHPNPEIANAGLT